MRTSTTTLALSSGLMAVVCAVLYEGSQWLAFPHLTVWQSHGITAALVAISVATVGYFTLRSRARLVAQLSEELAERVRTEAALRATEERYRLLYERNQAGVFHTSLDGRVIDCNEAAARILGFESSESILSVKVVDLYANAEDRAAFVKQLRANGHVALSRFPMRRRDGSLVWLVMNASLVQEAGGHPPFIEGTFVDITGLVAAEQEARSAVAAAEAGRRELEESREHLQLALDGADEALWDWNIAGNRTYYSRQWAQMLGYAPDEIGDSVGIWEQLLHPDDKPLVTRKLAAHVAGETASYEAEFRMKAKHGGWRWIQARGRVVARGPDGSAQRVAGTHVDITEHKQLRDALASARDASMAASKAKSAFLASMSHEIRTPMNAILGYTQLMLRDPAVTARMRGNLDIINRSGEHLLGLIEDILVMSKIEAGRMELKQTPFEASALLHDIDGMFRLRAEAKHLRFDVVMERCDAETVRGDLNKLRQVLINLVGNAVKFTDRGHIAVQASVRRRLDGVLWFSARVEDTGSGIAAEEQPLLFQPFVQGKCGSSRQSGTGLGLAISAEFARLMGGTLTVSSEPGTGSVFVFEAPVEAGRGDAAGAGARERRVVSLRAAGRHPPRVLIVDDEPHNRGWLSELLALIGFEVRDAEDGDEAIRQWLAWKPDLILMDVRMPRVDGLEATRAIRAASGGNVPRIIALTASALSEERQTSLASGVDDFLTKPCRNSELLEKIRSVLGIEYEYAGEGHAAVPLPAARPALADHVLRLPDALLEQLHESVVSGDKDRLDQLIHEVETLDADASAVLTRLADDFDYAALDALFQRSAPAAGRPR